MIDALHQRNGPAMEGPRTLGDTEIDEVAGRIIPLAAVVVIGIIIGAVIAAHKMS